MLTAAGAPAAATSFIATTSGEAPTDLVNQPDKIYSFDPGTITWRFTPQFLAVFPDPRLHEQVRLAFKEWRTASISHLRRQSNRYHWTRWNGQRDFCDVRSIVTHELGHALGSQHPDASWFNNNYQRNFRLDNNDDWYPAPPPGGEVMNEGNFGGKGIQRGEYRRILSLDEIDLLDHAYGAELEFVEIPSQFVADIDLIVHNVGGSPGNNLGAAGPDSSEARVEGDPDAGRRILRATISLNAVSNCFIGFEARAANWEVTNNTGKAIEALSIRARGTDNKNPIDISSSGARRFTNFQPSPAVSATQFEDRAHHYLDPVGGNVPQGHTVGVGLQLDVWDWTVQSAIAKATDNSLHPVTLVNIFGFVDTLTAPPNPTHGGGHIIVGDELHGLDEAALRKVAATGFRIVNPSDQAVLITTLELASVDGFGYELADLTSATLGELSQERLTERFAINEKLDAGEELVIILDGKPLSVRDGEYLDLARPELAKGELLVAVGTETDNADVLAMTILNGELIGGSVSGGTPSSPSQF